jgi:hypothetical protein
MVNPGEFHSECRTIFKKTIGQTEVASFDPLILDEAERFVKELSRVAGDPWDVVQS